jgi:thioredoxin-like negative regulator of GroEL
MNQRSTLPELARKPLADPAYSLDIVHGVARIGLGPLRAGPVRVDDLLLEVAPLDYPFDLMALRAGLPERSTEIGAIHARVSDRHIRELLPANMALTVFPGRAFLHGPVKDGGRALVEFVTDPDPPSGRVALKIASALRIGGSGGPIDQLLSLGSPGMMPDLQREPKSGRVVIDLLRWISGFVLCPMGWKVPLNAPDLLSYLILKEGMVHIEASHADTPHTMELGAQPPTEVMARMRGRDYAISMLSDIRAMVQNEQVDEAVDRTGRLVVSAGGFGADVLVEAAGFLPALAVSPMARTQQPDFRLKVLEGNTLLIQGAPEAAAEAWINAADQANPTEEPIYAVELLRAAFDVLEGDLRERNRVVQRAYPILISLMQRLPDERSLGELVVSLGSYAPFELRYRALGSVLFAPTVRPVDIERARQLLEESVRRGFHNQGVELATLIAARKGTDPDILFLCARAQQAGGNHRKAQEIWERLHEVARARGREDLYTACSVHLETNAPDEEARIRLAGLERKLSNQPFAMAAWLDRASTYAGFVQEEHMDKALDLLERMPHPALVDVLRKTMKTLDFSMLYRCKLAANLLSHGLACSEDLQGIAADLPDENIIRRLFRALRLTLQKTSDEALRIRAEALTGRILLHRYDRADDARAHLQAAWDGNLRGRDLADDLARVFIDSGYPQAAQRILLTHLLSEQNPEDRVELGVHLLELLPAETPLLSELRALLLESSKLVPWDERIRHLLDMRRGMGEVDDWLQFDVSERDDIAFGGMELEAAGADGENGTEPWMEQRGDEQVFTRTVPPQREDISEEKYPFDEDGGGELLELEGALTSPPVPLNHDAEVGQDPLEDDILELLDEEIERNPEVQLVVGETTDSAEIAGGQTSNAEPEGESGSGDDADDDDTMGIFPAKDDIEESEEREGQAFEGLEAYEANDDADERELDDAATEKTDEDDLPLAADPTPEQETKPSELPISDDRIQDEDEDKPEMHHLLKAHDEELEQIRKLAGSGAFDDARRRIRSLLKYSPDLSEAHVLLVVVAEAQGRLSEAVDHLLTRIDAGLNKDEARPLMLHALDLLVAAQRNEEARVHLRTWLTRDPEMKDALPPSLRELIPTD